MKRKPITAKQRLECFASYGAIVLCQCDDPECDVAVYISEAEIDHALALIDGGKHEGANFRPVSPGCHARKSAREHIANCKSKRLAKATETHEAVVAKVMARPAGKLRSRGFDKSLSRKFSGEVVRRG